jgi:hypothetical protein
MGVLPTRPYKPRDKAKVESGVQLVQRWIVAALRRHRFYSVDEANQAIRPLLTRLNGRPFRKRDGSRASVFQEVDRPALRPLPTPGADVDMTAQRRRAAALNGPERLQLLEIETFLVPVQEAVALRVEDVGHLHGGSAHSCLWR